MSRALYAVPTEVIGKLAAYCGPTALAAVTGRRPELFVTPRQHEHGDGGMSLAEVAAALGRPRGAWRHFGTIHRTKLYEHGVMGLMQRQVRRGTVTLARFCRPGRRGVVCVDGHFLAVADCLVLDSHVRRPTWAPDHPLRTRRVKAFLPVE